MSTLLMALTFVEIFLLELKIEVPAFKILVLAFRMLVVDGSACIFLSPMITLTPESCFLKLEIEL
jgi:hypothetical protein